MQIPLALKQGGSKASDAAAKAFGKSAAILVWICLGFFFAFVAYKGFAGLWQYGIKSVFFSTAFSLGKNTQKASFWAPFSVTLALASIVTLITIPMAVKCSVWSIFYCPPKFRKALMALFALFANLPSIILGLFVHKHLAGVVQVIFFMDSSFNITTAIVALVFMILPLIVIIFNSVLENKKEFITAALVLGVDRNYAVYRVLMPKIRKTVIVAATLITGKVFSESIMLSMLLSSQNYIAAFKEGILGFFSSQLSSVASLISENFYADGSDKNVQDLMFLFGALLLIFSLLFNAVCTPWISKDSDIVYSKIKILAPFIFLINYLGLRYLWFRFVHGRRLIATVIFLRRFIEVVSISMFLVFVGSVLVSIFYGGIIALSKWDAVFPNVYDSLWRALLNTLLIISLTIFTTIPFALFLAFYLSEYSDNSRFRKYTISLINTASFTPSIIYGIFGLSFFINTLGLSAGGRSGRSILAGVLTVIVFILPYLTQLFYTHISAIPNHYREAANVLGVNKFHVFAKVLLPIAATNLMFSILLAMGKVIGETAPLYLTAGLNSLPGASLLMHQGQTLTTRIYSKIYDVKLTERDNAFGETAFFCILLLSFLIFIGKYFIPWLQVMHEKYGFLPLYFFNHKIKPKLYMYLYCLKRWVGTPF